MPLLGTSGLFAARQRSAAGLEGVLRAHFGGAALRVEPCFERRAPIPTAQRLRLGAGRMRLGEDTCLGERILDRSGAFRIAIGPLDLAGFRRLLPGGEDLTRLVRLVRLYVSEPLDFHVLLRLKALEVPALRLAPAENLPLGYLSWLCPRGHEEGRAQVSISSLDPLRAPRARTAVPPRSTSPAPKSAVTTVKTPSPGSRSAPRVTTIRRA